ncbi:RepA family replication protein [Escherichia coli]|uniref:RepA family replication protein n=1 Tax=Escherichia coli TaxID=562 RepID=UPI00203F4447|nr:RepA family replication protein [Escherichia coli]
MRCSWRCVFYYDPLSNKVLRSLREIALECGLATKSLSGEVSITRAIRALESLEKDFEFVACSSDCYSTAEIFFTPKLFEFLGVFPLSLSEARTEVSGRQKQRQGECR